VGTSRTKDAPTGWLIRLDRTGAVLWQKFVPCVSASDALETTDHGLLVLSMDFPDQGDSRLDKFNANGVVVASRRITGSLGTFVRPASGATEIEIATQLDEGKTRFLRLDSAYQDVGRPKSLGKFHVRSGFELSDRSIVLFGSVPRLGETAAVGRIFSHFGWGEYPLEPLHASGWFDDAIPADRPGEYATVRRVGFGSVLTWISIEK
jgi:hypothetical protein